MSEEEDQIVVAPVEKRDPGPDLDAQEKPEPRGFANAPWMTSFIDTIALTLTFFVLLYSMSTIEPDKFKALSDSLQEELNPAVYQGKKSPGLSEENLTMFRRYAIDLDYLSAILEQQFAENDLLTKVRVIKDNEKLVISLPSDLLFEPASATLTNEARGALFQVGSVLSNVRNRMDLDGHTDPNPISSRDFPSNWELSTARALNVADELRKGGFKRSLVAKGLADSQFSRIPQDLPDWQRYSLARRVDIVVYPDEAE